MYSNQIYLILQIHFRLNISYAVYCIDSGMSRVAINFYDNQRLNLGKQQHKKEPRNAISHQVDETLKERQMKYRKIVETLNKIFYLIGKQRIFYRGTQERAANSDTLFWLVTHCYFLVYGHIHSFMNVLHGAPLSSYSIPFFQTSSYGYVEASRNENLQKKV